MCIAINLLKEHCIIVLSKPHNNGQELNRVKNFTLCDTLVMLEYVTVNVIVTPAAASISVLMNGVACSDLCCGLIPGVIPSAEIRTLVQEGEGEGGIGLVNF